MKTMPERYKAEHKIYLAKILSIASETCCGNCDKYLTVDCCRDSTRIGVGLRVCEDFVRAYHSSTIIKAYQEKLERFSHET